jgi:hypothetical protein
MEGHDIQIKNNGAQIPFVPFPPDVTPTQSERGVYDHSVVAVILLLSSNVFT